MHDGTAPSLHDPSIFENARSAIWRVIAGVRGRVRVGDAEDVVQETLLRALRHGLHGGIDPVPYIVGIARHVLADLFRRRTRELLSACPSEDPADGTIGPDFGEEPVPQRQPLWEFINKWLDRQPPEIRSVLRRRLLGGDSRRVALTGSKVSCRTLRTVESRLRQTLLSEIRRSDPELAASLHRNLQRSRSGT
jgi:DNA-directed RNA polymerase specialized sigma24 family protein